LTRYGTAYYGAPISIYGLDEARVDNQTKEGSERKPKKNRMNKEDRVA